MITEWLSWRWTFFINVPVGVVALMLSRTLLPTGIKQKGKVDIAGALAITATLVLTVYAIVMAEHVGWTSTQTITLLVASVVLLIVFLVIQAMRKEPIVPLSIFKVPNLSAGNIVLGLLAGAWIPLWFYLNLYLQQVLKYSAFAGGLALVPMTLLIMILMVSVTGRLVGRFGYKSNVVLGMIVLGVSLFLFASATPLGGNFVLNVLPASLLAALGMSLAYIPATMAAMSGAKQEETGLASGLANTSYQIGSALGLAAMVAISSSKTASELSESVEQVLSLNRGFHSAFWTAGILAIVGALIALVFLRQSRR